MSRIKSCHCLIPCVGALSRGIGTQRIPTWVDYSGYSKVEATAPFLTTCLQLHQRCPPIRLILYVKYMFSKYEICKNQMYMQVALDKTSQDPPLRKSFASFRGPIRVAFSKIQNSYQESNISNQTNSNGNTTKQLDLIQWQVVFLLFLTYTTLYERRYYLLLGLSRIFRKPFASVYTFLERYLPR